MTITTFDAFKQAELLQEEGFNRSQAKALTEMVICAVGAQHQHLATQQDIRQMQTEIRLENQQKYSNLSHDIEELRLGMSEFRLEITSKFTSLETKVDNKIAALDAKIDGKIAALDAKIDGKIMALDAKIDNKIMALDAKIDINDARAETRFEQLDKKIVRTTINSSIAMGSFITLVMTVFGFFLKVEF